MRLKATNQVEKDNREEKFTHIKEKGSGYILAEGLVAAAIIATAIVGILALLTTSLRHMQIARNQFIASMLALEGVEVVRAIRDGNWINGRLWSAGLAPGDYQLQYDSTTLQSFINNPLRFDPATRRYQHDTGANTEFTRRIIISSVNPDQIRVISRVIWTARGIPFSIDVEEHLFNWLR